MPIHNHGSSLSTRTRQNYNREFIHINKWVTINHESSFVDRNSQNKESPSSGAQGGGYGVVAAASAQGERAKWWRRVMTLSERRVEQTRREEIIKIVKLY